MKRKDCYLCYSEKDRHLAIQLKHYMLSLGVSVWFAPDEISAGSNFKEVIFDAIRSCDCMIVILSENSIQSDFVEKEVSFAYDIARGRNKQIFPVIIDDVVLREFRTPNRIGFYLATYQCVKVDVSDTSWPTALFPFLQRFLSEKQKAYLYEELSELIKSNLYLEASTKITEIISNILLQIQPQVSLRNQHELVIELDQRLEQLHAFYDNCDVDYSQEARIVTQHKLDVLTKLNNTISQIVEEKRNLFFVCSMIRFIFWDREIRLDCADMITHGDVSSGIVHTLPESEYAEKQREYRNWYMHNSSLPTEPEAVQRFIQETVNYLYFLEPKARQHIAKRTTAPNEQLEAIAGYIREGNRIFERIGDDEKAGAFIRCLVTSYERLRNYCQEIGASSLTAECIERITDLRNQIQLLDDEEQRNHSTAELGIRALLGFTRPGTGNYDVFLSHRGYDIDIARKVYQFLKARMKEVFFDTVSLSGELSDTDYKNAIYQALERSKHFVVIITELNELEPGFIKHEKDWMQEEMDVFHSELIEGRKRGGNFVIIVTDDIYQQIVSANKTNIDLKWRRHSLIRLNDYQDQIMGYIKE